MPVKILWMALVSILILLPQAVAADHAGFWGEIARQDASAEQPAGITEQDRKRLEQDARELSEEFKTLFKDLAAIGGKLTRSLIDSIAQWIRENYPQISAESRRKLQEFMVQLRLKYQNLETLSLETLQDMLNDLNELIDKLEKQEEQDQENVYT